MAKITLTEPLYTKPVLPAFSPSPYQAAIFDWIDTGTGNAIVRAVAGSGKTTTIVQAASRTTGSAIFLAFNKSIAEELKTRLPSRVQARTFHSLCYSPVLREVGAKEVNASKLRDLVRNKWEGDRGKLYGAFAVKLVGLARSSGIGCLVADTEEAWNDLTDLHNITLDNEAAKPVEAIQAARDLLTLSNESPEVDFDDLLYQAVRLGIKLPSFDWVFVDEAQDTNAIQRAILRKISKGRLVAVGDPAQAIYGFREADSQSLQRIAEEFQAITLPLSVSYRCAKSIVAAAKHYVPEIEHHDSAPDGVITDLAFKWTTDIFNKEDLVICRSTRPLVQLAYLLMRDRVPCRILGRDLGENLIGTIRRMKADNIDNLLLRLQAWRDREVEKAIAKGEEILAEKIDDQAGAIAMLANDLPETERSIAHLIQVINDLFGDATPGRLMLCTIHKGKGLEAHRVFWLNRSLCPSRWAKQEWQQAQERNLMYVATTRAKHELVLIEMKR